MPEPESDPSPDPAPNPEPDPAPIPHLHLHRLQTTYGLFRTLYRKLAAVPTPTYDWKQHQAVDDRLGPWAQRAKRAVRGTGRRGSASCLPLASRPPLVACVSLAIHSFTAHAQHAESTRTAHLLHACTLPAPCQARGGSGARPAARPRCSPDTRGGGADVRAWRGARARAGTARRPRGAALCHSKYSHSKYSSATSWCRTMSKPRWLSLRPACWLSGACSLRQSMPHAAPSFGQPRPISRLGRAGRQHRPCFRHRCCGARSAC